MVQLMVLSYLNLFQLVLNVKTTAVVVLPRIHSDSK